MSLKRKIVSGIATISLVGALVGGATLAIFTDTATNSGNTFGAGTLDINASPETSFAITNMAPGDFGSETITIINDGSLELRYDIATTLSGALAATGGLEVTIKDAAGTVIVPGTDNDRVLAAGANEVLTVSYILPLSADNTFQDTSATLDLSFDAEQTANNP